MARIVLKDPSEPTTKKPRVVVEKERRNAIVERQTAIAEKEKAVIAKQNLAKYLKLSIYLNFWLAKLVIYFLYKPTFDVLFEKLLNNIKQLI